MLLATQLETLKVSVPIRRLDSTYQAIASQQLKLGVVHSRFEREIQQAQRAVEVALVIAANLGDQQRTMAANPGGRGSYPNQVRPDRSPSAEPTDVENSLRGSSASLISQCSIFRSSAFLA